MKATPSNQRPRLLYAVLTGLLLLPLFTGTSAAAAAVREDEGYPIELDGMPYTGASFTLGGRAYVALREFACAADNAVVRWEEETATAVVTTDSLELYAAEGDFYLNANGRILWCENGLFTEDGVLYAPLDPLARAFGFTSSYNAAENSTSLTRTRGAIVPEDEFYNAEDLYWLAKIIHAESRGEPFRGKLAVGAVILNRVDDADFPDTIYDVIFDREHGVQFTPTVDGAIEQEAGEESVLAAKICLEDMRLTEDALYFLNEAIATNFWIVENCTRLFAIGDHTFYAP